MIAVFIFYIHIVAAATIFTKRWQEAGLGEGFLAVGFILLIFSVGWSVTTFILKLFIEKEGLAVWLDRDTLSLVLLTIAEIMFYYIYIVQKKK